MSANQCWGSGRQGSHVWELVLVERNLGGPQVLEEAELLGQEEEESLAVAGGAASRTANAVDVLLRICGNGMGQWKRTGNGWRVMQARGTPTARFESRANGRC